MNKISLHGLTAVLVTPLVLVGCGGSSSDSNANAPSSANYNFAIPVLNSQRVYNKTIADNASNIINLSYTDTVVAKNPDGTYQVQTDDPSGNSVTVNGTNYSIAPVLTTYNSSGQVLATFNKQTYTSCSFVPFGPGPTFPTELNIMWSGVYNETCGATTTTFNQYGGIGAAVKSTTVPAGTFQTLAISTGITFQLASGISYGQSITTDRDVNTGTLIQQTESDTYSTAPAASYPTAVSIVLVSQSP